MGLALGTNLKFYTSVTKRLKLKVRKFWGLIRTFVGVTGGKLVGGVFYLYFIVAQLSVLDVCRSPDYVSNGDEVLPTAKNTLTSKVEAVANSKSDYMSYFIKEICLPYL